ncbi:MAG: hypothetical protein WD691_05405 [Acidimicrobiales bacterium]
MVGRRGSNQNLWLHGALLGVVLLLLLPLVGPYGSVSVDDGGAAIQAKALAGGDGWSLPPPIASIPYEDLHFPLTKASETDAGWAPFARHPMYAVLLAALFRVAGELGMVLSSLAGLVLAAVGAGHLTRRAAGDHLSVVGLWGVGLGTPLLFDGYVLIAHTLGAACVAWAAVLVWDTSGVRSLGGRAARLVGVWILILLGVLLRAEVVLVALAAGAVMVCAAIRSRRVAEVATAAVLVGAAGAGLIIEMAWRRNIGTVAGGVGGPTRSVQTDGSGWLRDRWSGVEASLLNPGTGRYAPLLALSLFLLATLVVMIRMRSGRHLTWTVGVAAGISAVGWGVAERGALVPGLLMACPFLVLASLLGPGRVVLDARTRALTAALLLGATGIVALQYDGGGYVEWGGRYFAVLLPGAAAVAVSVLASARLSERERRWTVTGLAIFTGGLSVMALVALHDIDHYTDETLRDISAYSVPARLASAPTDVRPVLITSQFAAPRLDWRRYDQHRWVLIGSLLEDDVEPGVDRQVRAVAADMLSPRRVTLVSVRLDEDLRRLGPHRVVRGPSRIGPFVVVIVELL